MLSLATGSTGPAKSCFRELVVVAPSSKIPSDDGNSTKNGVVTMSNEDVKMW